MVDIEDGDEVRIDHAGFARVAVNVYAGSPGTKSLANGNAHAVSQYDVACFQYSQHH